jgi:hypothetical protein
MKSSTKADWVIMISVTLIVAVVRYNFAFEQFLTRSFGFPDGSVLGEGPGNNPPFYFLRQDAMDGLCAGIAMGLALVLVAVTWKRYRRASSMAFFMAWIWCMPGLVRGLIIWWRCPHLMDPQRAVSAWPTFDAWMYDPLPTVAMFLTLVLGVGWAFLCRKSVNAQPPADSALPTAVGSTV